MFGRKPDVLVRQQAMGRPERPAPADLAARSEVVFFLLGDLEQIEAQLTGPSGFEAGVHSPTIAVIATALRPRGTAQPGPPGGGADRRPAPAGRRPAVRTPVGGAPGRALIAVGAASSAYPGIEPVLSLLGPCLRVGGIGSAQVAHACEQLMVAAAAVGLGEAVMMAEGVRAGCRRVAGQLAPDRRRRAMVDAAREQTGSRDAERELPAVAGGRSA